MTFYRRHSQRREGERRGPDRRLADRRGAAFDPAEPPPSPPPPPPLPPTLVGLPPRVTAIGPNPYRFLTPIPTAADAPIPDGSGWKEVYNQAGLLTVVDGQLVATFPSGFTPGHAPGTLYFPHAPVKRHFMAFPYQWDAGMLAALQKGGVKTHVMQSASNTQIEPIFNKTDKGWMPDSLFYNGIRLTDVVAPGQLTTRASRMAGYAGVPVDLTQPHIVRTLLDYNLGIYQQWLDDVLVIDLSGLTYPADAGITTSKIYPGLGGDTNAMTQAGKIAYGDVVLAGA